MKPLHILRHHPKEGPGYLAEVLDNLAIPYKLFAIDQGDTVPHRLDDTSGLVFMGGPMSVNDPLPWIADELKLIRDAAEKNIPLLGHCLGGQLISKALGGEVAPMGRKEIGWFDVEQLNSTSEWLADVPQRFSAFHWHGERFTLPEGACLLLKSDICDHQAYIINNNILAMQCHIEMTAPMINAWCIENSNELLSDDPGIQSTEKMNREIHSRISQLQQVADTIYKKWLQHI
jgi:GMP synthase-like glutamine amidotransferase